MQLYKRNIDSYKPGKTVCSLQLSATLSEYDWTRRVPKRSYLTVLNGAREPNNQMVIVFDPVDPQYQGVCV